MRVLILFFLILPAASLHGSSAGFGHSILDRVEQVENELFELENFLGDVGERAEDYLSGYDCKTVDWCICYNAGYHERIDCMQMIFDAWLVRSDKEAPVYHIDYGSGKLKTLFLLSRFLRDSGQKKATFVGVDSIYADAVIVERLHMAWSLWHMGKTVDFVLELYPSVDLLLSNHGTTQFDTMSIIDMPEVHWDVTRDADEQTHHSIQRPAKLREYFESLGTFSAEKIESEVSANEQLLRLRAELRLSACILLYANKTYFLA